MKTILAVEWDFDGTIGDTEPLHREKLIVVSARNGVTLREEDFAQQHVFAVPDGQGGRKDVSMILHGAGDEMLYHWLVCQKSGLKSRYPMKQWLQEVMDYYVDHADSIKPRETIPDVIEELHHQTGAIQGIVTVGLPRQVQANLRAVNGIKKRFQFVITGEHVTKKKPHPEAYHLGHAQAKKIAAKRDASASVFGVGVEDSPIGTQAVVAAGLGCVHYVLPGQQPFRPEGAQSTLYRVAKTSMDVLCVIQELYRLHK